VLSHGSKDQTSQYEFEFDKDYWMEKAKKLKLWKEKSQDVSDEELAI